MWVGMSMGCESALLHPVEEVGGDGEADLLEDRLQLLLEGAALLVQLIHLLLQLAVLLKHLAVLL